MAWGRCCGQRVTIQSPPRNNRFSIDDRIACSAGSCYVMLQGERRLLCAAVWAVCIRGALIYRQGCQFDCGATPCTAETIFDTNTCCIQIVFSFWTCINTAMSMPRTLNNKPRPEQTCSNTFTIMSDFAKLRYCKHRATTMRSIADSFSWFLIV